MEVFQVVELYFSTIILFLLSSINDSFGLALSGKSNKIILSISLWGFIFVLVPVNDVCNFIKTLRLFCSVEM